MTSTTTHTLEYVVGYESAAEVTGTTYFKMYGARRNGRLPGARVSGNHVLIPTDALRLNGHEVANDSNELITTRPWDKAENVPGRAYYYRGHVAAAKATGTHDATMAQWLGKGAIPGAWQPRGKHTEWLVPVDGLWVAGFAIITGKPVSEPMDPAPVDYWDTRPGAPLPPLHATLAEAANTIDSGRQPTRLKRDSLASSWIHLWATERDLTAPCDYIHPDDADNLTEYLARHEPHDDTALAPQQTALAPRGDWDVLAPQEATEHHAMDEVTADVETLRAQLAEQGDTLHRIRNVVDEMYNDALDLHREGNGATGDWIAHYAAELRKAEK